MTDNRVITSVTCDVAVQEPAVRKVRGLPVPAAAAQAQVSTTERVLAELRTNRASSRSSVVAAATAGVLPVQRSNSRAQVTVPTLQLRSIKRTAAVVAAKQTLLGRATSVGTWSCQLVRNSFGVLAREVSLSDFKAWIRTGQVTGPAPQGQSTNSPTLHKVAMSAPRLPTVRAATVAVPVTGDLSATTPTSISARIIAAADRELALRQIQPCQAAYGRTKSRRVVRAVPASIHVRETESVRVRQRIDLTLKTYTALGQQQAAWRALKSQGVRPAGPAMRTIVNYETPLGARYRSDLSAVIESVIPRHPGLRFRLNYEGQTMSAPSHDQARLAESRKVTLQVFQDDGRAATREQLAAVTGDLASRFKRGVKVPKPVVVGRDAALRRQMTLIHAN